MRWTRVITAAAAALLCTVDAIEPLVVKGSKFFGAQSGKQFYIKGVDYQPTQNATTPGQTIFDPLADPAGCTRDIKLMTPAGVNAIRVYAINTSLDHSNCINQFAQAGIYVVSDLSEPGFSIDRSNPSWTVNLLQRYAQVVDQLAPYNNTLGFFAGNEVTNNNTNSNASPFVKAAIRDTKSYIKAKGYRAIPVGYSSSDAADIRMQLLDYFNCGDASTRADMYGVNIYEWCGNSTYATSGYQARTEEIANYSIPVFMSEFGCNIVLPRRFTEIQAIYGPQMSPIWSGGLVYEWFQQTNNYGLVSLSGTSVTTRTDYPYWKSELAAATPTGVAASAYTPTNSPAACPPVQQYWSAASSLPPVPDTNLCACMVSSLQCVLASPLNSNDTATLFGEVCGLVSCDGINSNGTSPGTYGAYSMCASDDKLSWALNQYYLSQNKASSACNFNGQAKTQTANAASSCSAALQQAGNAGTGTVSSTPNLGSVNGSSSGNGSSTSGSSSGSSSSSVGSGISVPVMFVMAALFACGSSYVVL